MRTAADWRIAAAMLAPYLIFVALLGAFALFG
jgi:hypothetical protein